MLSAECYVLSLHITCREHRHKWRRRGRLLNCRASLRFLALNKAHHADNIESEFAGGFDSLNCRGTGRAHVIHNHDAGALLAEALNPLTSAVLLLRLPDEEGVDVPAHHGD